MTQKPSISIKTKYNIDDLVNIIESHSENNIRLDALCKLEQVNLIQDKSRIVKFLENLIVSDENIQIRCKALEVLTKKFPDLAFKVSKWIIENEILVFLFSVVLKMLSNTNSILFDDIKEALLNRYIRHYKLVKEEAQFMMDLELLYSESYNSLEFGIFISEPEGRINAFDIADRIIGDLCTEKYYFYLKVGKRLRILDLSRLNSKLCEIPASIGNLKRLKRLYLCNHQLSSLPSSIEKLKRLKFLSLNNNRFDSIPIKPLLNLKRLENLFINNNPIKKISRLDLKFIKKNFARNYEKMGVQKSNAIVLSLIEVFQGYYPDIYDCDLKDMTFTDHDGFRDPDCLPWTFKNNNNGHITGLGLNDVRGDLLIKHICKLKHLEKLWVLVGNVKKVPKSIKKIKSLKELCLSRNQIKVIPKCIKSLKQIREIDLDHNKIEKIPTFFKNFNSLEILRLHANKIKTIPEFFKEIKSLKSLFIYRNDIKICDEIKEKLSNIKWLFL